VLLENKNAITSTATETFMRYLAAEVGSHGVRVLGIWTVGVAETLSDEKIAGVCGENAPDAQTVEEMIAGLAGAMANVTCGPVLK
jgi:enoyl-[acyl-carrier-protein] reductase (NADH)